MYVRWFLKCEEECQVKNHLSLLKYFLVTGKKEPPPSSPVYNHSGCYSLTRVNSLSFTPMQVQRICNSQVLPRPGAAAGGSAPRLELAPYTCAGDYPNSPGTSVCWVDSRRQTSCCFWIRAGTLASAVKMAKFMQDSQK